MRPQRLRLSAFGPFASPVEVDFSAFEGAPLLLIHGQTGGGKTTLLDAMCFALYGETSGSERSAREMKSHHAPDVAETQVTFEFSVRGRSYRVERAFRASGKSRFSLEVLAGERWQTLASKAGEGEARLREILGLDGRQFRQVVLLPQGRFRDFLEASSKDREAILESLFDTSRYREIEEALRERASEVRSDVQAAERRRELLLEQAGGRARRRPRARARRGKGAQARARGRDRERPRGPRPGGARPPRGPAAGGALLRARAGGGGAVGARG